MRVYLKPKTNFKVMAKQLNPEAKPSSEIELKGKAIDTLNTAPQANDLNEYFDDSKHLDEVGNVADENAIWVYFGVGGPA